MMKKRMKLEQKKATLGIFFVLPWFLGFVFLFTVPLYESFIYSISHMELGKGGFNTENAGFLFYKELFVEHATFTRTLVEAITDIVINVPSIIIFSLFVATLLNQSFRGRAFARAVFFLPVLLAAPVLSLENSSELSTVASAVTGTSSGEGNVILKSFELQRILLEAGVAQIFVDYISGSVNRIYEIISSSGVQILIFLAGLQSISPSLYEAAKIEGATGYESFWKITLPMISPLLLTNLVYSVIDTYSSNNLSGLITETAFKSLNFSLSAAMSWVYFLAISLILIVSVSIVSRRVFYYD